jgi:hypothetical protein
MIAKQLYRYKEVEDLLSISERTRRRMIVAGEFEIVNIHNSPRITARSVEKFLPRPKIIICQELKTE